MVMCRRPPRFWPIGAAYLPVGVTSPLVQARKIIIKTSNSWVSYLDNVKRLPARIAAPIRQVFRKSCEPVMQIGIFIRRLKIRETNGPANVSAQCSDFKLT